MLLMSGRILITLGTLITLVGPNIADWNETHVFSELWSPHAHFHGAWSIFTTTFLSTYAIASLPYRDSGLLQPSFCDASSSAALAARLYHGIAETSVIVRHPNMAL
jgi:hypothetical protein